MFAISVLTREGIAKCFSGRSWSRRETHRRRRGQGGCRRDYIPAIWAFKLRKLIVAGVSLAELPTYQSCSRDSENKEAITTAGGSSIDLNLGSSSTTFYPRENHYSPGYFLKESLSHSRNPQSSDRAQQFPFYAYNPRQEKSSFRFAEVELVLLQLLTIPISQKMSTCTYCSAGNLSGHWDPRRKEPSVPGEMDPCSVMANGSSEEIASPDIGSGFTGISTPERKPPRQSPREGKSWGSRGWKTRGPVWL